MAVAPLGSWNKVETFGKFWGTRVGMHVLNIRTRSLLWEKILIVGAPHGVQKMAEGIMVYKIIFKLNFHL